MLKVLRLKSALVVIEVLTLLLLCNFCTIALAQEDTSPCPKPYIKLIKPNLAKVGEQIVIRGHRFGDAEQTSEVIFPPGASGKIISWGNSRITVEIPPGAKTGNVVVKTRCATSNGEFFKVAE